MNYMDTIDTILKTKLPAEWEIKDYRKKVFDFCNALPVGEARKFSDARFVKPSNLPLFLQYVNEYIKNNDVSKGQSSVIIDEKNCLIVKRNTLPPRRQRRLKKRVIQNSSKDKHHLALNVIKFKRYNFDFFSCEEAVFFEYIIIK